MNAYNYAPQAIVENNISMWSSQFNIKQKPEKKIFTYYNNMKPKEEKYNFYSPLNSEIFDVALLKNISKLEKIEKLEDNWNENGAKKFSKSHIEKVKEILKFLPKQPSIFPTAMESIQLEYEKEDKYLEFNIYNNNQVNIYYESSNDSYEMEIPLELKTIVQKIKTFYNEV